MNYPVLRQQYQKQVYINLKNMNPMYVHRSLLVVKLERVEVLDRSRTPPLSAKNNGIIRLCLKIRWTCRVGSFSRQNGTGSRQKLRSQLTPTLAVLFFPVAKPFALCCCCSFYLCARSIHLSREDRWRWSRFHRNAVFQGSPTAVVKKSFPGALIFDIAEIGQRKPPGSWKNHLIISAKLTPTWCYLSAR